MPHVKYPHTHKIPRYFCSKLRNFFLVNNIYLFSKLLISKIKFYECRAGGCGGARVPPRAPPWLLLGRWGTGASRERRQSTVVALTVTAKIAAATGHPPSPVSTTGGYATATPPPFPLPSSSPSSERGSFTYPARVHSKSLANYNSSNYNADILFNAIQTRSLV